MSDELEYRGYAIRAEPYQLQSGGWTLEGVLIERGSARQRLVRFSLAGTTESRAAAVSIIFDEGKRLIDFRST